MIARLSQFKFLRLCFAYGIGVSQAFAQTIPNDGQILRTLPLPPAPMKKDLDFRLQADTLSDVTPGGSEIYVHRVKLSGNTIFDDTELVDRLGDIDGRWFDFSEIQAMANRLSDYYRDRGYSFAKVYVPKQDVSAGTLELVVLEGKFGDIRTLGDEKYRKLVGGYLSSLEPGGVINGPALEAVFLKLGDVPGIRVAPVLKPGNVIGTGDLDVRVRPDTVPYSYVTTDNQGSRLSGKNRLSAGFSMPTIFGLAGHQMNLHATATNKDLRVYGGGYSWPISNQGARIRLDYTYVSYNLQDDTAQKFYGWAKIYRGTVSHILYRSQARNIILEYGFQEREAFSSVAGSPASDGSFKTLPIKLGFDLSDDFMSGGSWSGSVVYTRGRAKDNENTFDGLKKNWDKLSIDVTRRQNLGARWSASWRVSGQTSEDPIMDSSEQMSLGGLGGVRAYPSGEGSFSRVYVTQLELRYTAAAASPYVFIDHAKGTAFEDIEPSDREIGGYGFGVRSQYAGWALDAFVAHKRGGGISTSDSKFGDPVIQVSLQKRF